MCQEIHLLVYNVHVGARLMREKSTDHLLTCQFDVKCLLLVPTQLKQLEEQEI